MDQPDRRIGEEDLACRGISRQAGAAALLSPRALAFATEGPADQRAGAAPRWAPASVTGTGEGANDLARALARAFARAVRREIDRTLPASAMDQVADTLRGGDGSPGELGTSGHPDTGDPAELRSALRDFIVRLKTEGAPPERVVVAVKAAVAQGALAAGFPHDGRREAAVLTERVVRWAVLAYYSDVGA